MSLITKAAGIDPLIASVRTAQKTKKFGPVLLEVERLVRKWGGDSLADTFHIGVVVLHMGKESEA